MCDKTKMLVVVFSMFLLALALTGCATSGDDFSTSATPNLEQAEYENLIAQEESEDWESLQPQIQIQPWTEEDSAQMSQALNGNGYSVGQGKLAWDGGIIAENRTEVIGTGEPAFWVPVMQMAPSTWATLYDPFIVNGDASLAYQWDKYFHWTNHLSNRYALSANGAWVNSIIRGAMTGNGQVYYFPGNQDLQAQYLFVSKVSANGAQAARWSAILAENGAPVTTFNAGMKDGAYSEHEVERYINRMLVRGYTQVDPSQLPKEIRNVWGGDKNPPIIRYFLWSLKYQVEVTARIYALSIADSAAALGTWAKSVLPIPYFILIPDNKDFYLFPDTPKIDT